MTRQARDLVLALATLADCDPRTARAAIERGSASVRGRPGERCARAMVDLKIPDPSTKDAAE